MRISDWSSDVCSADLTLRPVHDVAQRAGAERRRCGARRLEQGIELEAHLAPSEGVELGHHPARPATAVARQQPVAAARLRSEERSLGHRGVSKCSAPLSPSHYHNITPNNISPT